MNTMREVNPHMMKLIQNQVHYPYIFQDLSHQSLGGKRFGHLTMSKLRGNVVGSHLLTLFICIFSVYK